MQEDVPGAHIHQGYCLLLRFVGLILHGLHRIEHAAVQALAETVGLILFQNYVCLGLGHVHTGIEIERKLGGVEYTADYIPLDVDRCQPVILDTGLRTEYRGPHNHDLVLQEVILGLQPIDYIHRYGEYEHDENDGQIVPHVSLPVGVAPPDEYHETENQDCAEHVAGDVRPVVAEEGLFFGHSLAFNIWMIFWLRCSATYSAISSSRYCISAVPPAVVIVTSARPNFLRMGPLLTCT